NSSPLSTSYSCSLLVLMLFFSLYCSAHHRDLHSFPTRRSSDLRPVACADEAADVLQAILQDLTTILNILEGRALYLKGRRPRRQDRKSTRLNSSHLVISYAVFCLKKKKQKTAYKYIISNTSKH